MDPVQAPGVYQGVANVIAAVMLLIEFGMLRQALARDQVRLYMAQSALISVLAIVIAADRNLPDLYALAALSAALKVVAVPLVLALGAVAVVMTARDAFTALFGWEALTLAFYLLAASERNKRGRAGAGQVTFAFGKVSGAALLAGLLLLATRSHSIMLASFAHVPGGAARTTAEVLLLGGFAVKAGLVPFQVWLPRGYAAAPGPARAIMAGVCVNVAFYGMWRTFALLGRPPGWLTGGLLVLGALSALLGIAHAAVQNRLSR